jgi:ABC-type multidrug transport system ATPase subunit
VSSALAAPAGRLRQVTEDRQRRDNLRTAARRCRVGDRGMEAALERVGLAERAADRVAGYSLGMRQRLGVAAALITRRRDIVGRASGSGRS